MLFIYDLIMHLVWCSLKCISPFNPKIKEFTSGRKLQRDASKILTGAIWFHCASVGEFEQGRPIIEKIKKSNSSQKILLSFFSPSGFNHLKDFQLADSIVYAPFDTSHAVNRFLNLYQPTALILIKYEFWKNLIHYSHQRSIPIFSVSSIFRKDQHYFKWYGNIFVPDLQRISHFFVQNESSKELLLSIGIKQITISGDTRFDRVIDIAENSVDVENVKEYCTNKKCLIAGSTWPEDEAVLHDAFAEFSNDWVLIIAPHEVKKSRIEAISKQFQAFKSIALSGASSADLSDNRVLIVDSIGLLNRIYRYADVCYVGGAFGTGLHNILEAAVWGKPIVHGPEHAKFKEATDLSTIGGSIVCQTKEEGVKALVQLQSDHEVRTTKGGLSKQYVYQNMGASLKVISYLKSKGIF